MATSIGIPVVSANIVVDAVETAVAIGDNVTVVTIGTGGVETTTTGNVVGIELMNKPFARKRDTAIYDGVPTSLYENPVCALIKNAADMFDVNALVIETPGETDEVPAIHTRIFIGDIKSVTAGETQPDIPVS